MFINLRSLITKPTKPGSYTEKFLSKPTIAYAEGEDFHAYSYHIVEAEEEMRPDLISIKFYGGPDFADLICKYNNINNPFTLEKGALLKIPYTPDQYYLQLGSKDTILDKGTVKAKPSTTQKSTTDPKRLAYLAEVAKAGGNNSISTVPAALPPNFNAPNQENIKRQDGLIIFGGDVTSGNSASATTTVARTNVMNKITSNE
jgi:hypothetical protein